MKLIGNLMLVLLACAVFGLLGFGISDSMAPKPAQAQARPLVTNAMIVLASPTAMPTKTATQAPTATPTNTAMPTIAPTATRDLAPAATEQAIILNAQATRIVLTRLETQAYQDRMVVTLGVVAGFVGLVVLLVAIVTAYVRTLRGDFRNPAQVAQAQAKAQPIDNPVSFVNPLAFDGYRFEEVREFAETVEKNLQGVYTASAESIFYPTMAEKNAGAGKEKPFRSQEELRTFVRKMKMLGYLIAVQGGGHELSTEFYSLMARWQDEYIG